MDINDAFAARAAYFDPRNHDLPGLDIGAAVRALQLDRNRHVLNPECVAGAQLCAATRHPNVSSNTSRRREHLFERDCGILGAENSRAHEQVSPAHPSGHNPVASVGTGFTGACRLVSIHLRISAEPVELALRHACGRRHWLAEPDWPVRSFSHRFFAAAISASACLTWYCRFE